MENCQVKNSKLIAHFFWLKILLRTTYNIFGFANDVYNSKFLREFDAIRRKMDKINII